MGAARQLLRQWKPAIAAHEEATRRAPYISYYWIGLALAREQQALAGDSIDQASAAAFAAAHRAVEVEPGEPTTHAALADVASVFGDLELAYAEIRTAVAAYPKGRGLAETATKGALSDPDVRGARAFLESLLQYKDTSALRVGIARVAMKMGDGPGAKENALRAVDLDPKNTEAQQLLKVARGLMR